ncbi:unnamed protein product [Mytilus edulis]|uniref:Uncharacterized protein n=1 Tax=Mytilus edulis TaxID=6550 RepID=A0A8S3RK39_MYTED|nr:unnamed protein product [Mytilus edulis]
MVERNQQEKEGLDNIRQPQEPKRTSDTSENIRRKRVKWPNNKSKSEWQQFDEDVDAILNTTLAAESNRGGENGEMLSTVLEGVEKDCFLLPKLRSYKSGVPPVIVKVVNSEVKTAIMRKKKQMKNHVKLYDDITIKNRDLLKGLRHHKDIDVAYYYNGSVFGKTKDGLQIIFDIFDDISYRIEYERTKDVNNANGES